MSKPDSFWFKILSFRYGDVQVQMMDYPYLMSVKNVSIWWKDLVGLTASENDKCNWFTKEIFFKLGNGISILFWKHIWIGQIFLLQKLKNILFLVVNPNILIHDVGYCIGDVWHWDFRVFPKTTLSEIFCRM